MVVQNKVNRKGAILLGKVIQGNNRSCVPNNFTLFKHVTSHPAGPTSCRSDGSFGKQIKGDQTSAPSYSFGIRTAAASIFGLPPPKKPTKQNYKKKRMYGKGKTIGYDPFEIKEVYQTQSQLLKSKSTSSVLPREIRHRGMRVGKLSNSFTQQYKVAHHLSKPKHPPKRLPTFGYYPEHVSAMAKMNR